MRESDSNVAALIFAGGVDTGYFNGRAPAEEQEVASSTLAFISSDECSLYPNRWFPATFLTSSVAKMRIYFEASGRKRHVQLSEEEHILTVSSPTIVPAAPAA